MWLFIGILAALFERGSTGRGARVAGSLLETGVVWTSLLMTAYQATGEVPGPIGSASPAAAPYEAFETSDSWILIAAGNDRLFAKLCRLLDLPELPQDARFKSNGERVPRRHELHKILEHETKRRTTDEWIRRMREAGIPAGPINKLDQVFADEQVNALGMFPGVPSTFRIPDLKLVDIAVSVNDQKSVKNQMPPLLGEHTEEVLRSAGYSDGELKVFRNEGITN